MGILTQKKTFESVSKRLSTIMGDFETIQVEAGAEIEIINAKQEELVRQKAVQIKEAQNAERVGKNIKNIMKLLTGEL